MQEIWKDITGYEGLYQISNLGNVKSLKRYVQKKHGTRIVKEKILKKTINSNGYLRLCLWKDNSCKAFSVHRLVAQAFLDNYSEKLQVNHKNGIRNDNRIENLEMVTCSENQIHAYTVLNKISPMKNRFGKDSPKAIKVIQYDLDSNFIKIWDSIIEASKKLNINDTSICNACRNRRKTAGGYIWKYADK